MPRPYTIIEGINAAHKYVIKHTTLESDEDLYQDIACEYIRIRNSGGDHQRACTELLRQFRTKKYTDRQLLYNTKHIEEIPSYILNANEDNILDRIVGDNLINIIHNILRENEEFVITESILDDRSLVDIAVEKGVGKGRIWQLKQYAIMKLKCSKIFRNAFTNPLGDDDDDF